MGGEQGFLSSVRKYVRLDFPPGWLIRLQNDHNRLVYPVCAR